MLGKLMKLAIIDDGAVEDESVDLRGDGG